MKTVFTQWGVTREPTGMAWFASPGERGGTVLSEALMFLRERKKVCFASLGYKSTSFEAPLLWLFLSPVASPTVLASDADVFAMSKPAAKKNHWTSRVNECSACKDIRGDLNVPLRGGAENGEFAYVGQVNEDMVVYKSGKLNEGELLLEVENLSISGLPLYDIQTLIKNCRGPVRLKTVRQGKELGAPHAQFPTNPFLFYVKLLSARVKRDFKPSKCVYQNRSKYSCIRH